MRKVICILLCAAIALSLSACGILNKGNDTAALQAQIDELKEQLAAATPGVSATEGEPVASAQYVVAINALVYPEGGDPASAASTLEITEPTSIVLTPVLPEGKVVDYWDINGQEFEATENQAPVITVDSTTFIKAVLRDELKVTSINACMQFLDEKGDPSGDEFYEYVFEYDDEYVSNKLITVYVKAEIPDGYTVDYWKINGVPYYFNKTVTAFTVENLDETTVYEVVFKKADAPSTPKPTSTPALNQTPEPTTTPSWSFIPIWPSFVIRPTPTPMPTYIGPN
jgi:hypothetical protein